MSAKNYHRLLSEELTPEFFALVLERSQSHLSKEHPTADATLIEAWVS